MTASAIPADERVGAGSVTYRRKLIEVALPLEAINRESQHEKSVPRKGHPATMHLWWARRPLAACRAVLHAVHHARAHAGGLAQCRDACQAQRRADCCRNSNRAFHIDPLMVS